MVFCIDSVAGIMPIITCPGCNSTNTRFCHEKGFVENTRFCRNTGFIAHTCIFGFVWCRLLHRPLGFDSDFAQISGLKIGGWQHWLMLKIVQVHVRMHHICAISFFCNKMLNELRIVQYASMSTCQVLQRPHPPTTAYQRKTVSSDKTESWRSYRGRGRVKRAGEGEWTLQVKQSNKDDHQIRKQSEWKVYDYAIYYILISKRIRNPRSNTSNDIKFHWNHLFIVWHKHRQRHNGPRRWLLWPVILVR